MQSRRWTAFCSTSTTTGAWSGCGSSRQRTPSWRPRCSRRRSRPDRCGLSLIGPAPSGTGRRGAARRPRAALLPSRLGRDALAERVASVLVSPVLLLERGGVALLLGTALPDGVALSGRPVECALR